MKINKIEPQGFCGGVKRAINIVNEILSDDKIKEPIYMLGSLIHNKFITDEFKEKGIIILDDKLTKEQMLEKIDYGTIIISAHGVAPKIKKIALDKGLNIVDTTCPYVELIHKNIISAINNKKDVIYIGSKGHPEAIGVLGIDEKINLITSLGDLKNLKLKSTAPYVTNQTTLSIYDIDEFYNEIKEKYPNAIIDNKICMATTKRQEAIYNQEKVDLCIIVGDEKSSNTKKLKDAAIKCGINTILVSSLDEIKKSSLDFKNLKSISISSGASTPGYLVDEIIDYLKRC